jgi:hypothetical protein
VVLPLKEDFTPHLVETLLDHFEGTTAALASAGSAAEPGGRERLPLGQGVRN